jgi:hypothetical protein
LIRLQLLRLHLALLMLLRLLLLLTLLLLPLPLSSLPWPSLRWSSLPSSDLSLQVLIFPSLGLFVLRLIFHSSIPFPNRDFVSLICSASSLLESFLVLSSLPLSCHSRYSFPLVYLVFHSLFLVFPRFPLSGPVFPCVGFPSLIVPSVVFFSLVLLP